MKSSSIKRAPPLPTLVITSSRYSLAPEAVSQLAVKPDEVTLDSADTVGAAGAELTVTAKVRAVPEPQSLSAVTETSPELEPKVTVISVVPDPAVIEAPDGTLQV